MNRFHIALTGLSILVASATGAAAGDPDNFVYYALPGVTEFNFKLISFNITPKNDMGPVSSGIDPKKGPYINVIAKRKGSTGVADWFKQQVAGGQTLACDSKSTFPKKLNFAVMGTLSMTIKNGTETHNVSCDNVIVAQGHDASNNNWWMGGPDMKGVHISFTGLTLQKCKIKDRALPAEVIFTPATPCVNHFNLSVNPL